MASTVTASFARERRFAGTGFAAGALVLVAAGSVSVALGQDANWDLLNYHLYNAWAFLDGRIDTDLAVAGISTYVNPLLDLPYYLAADRVPARALAFAMGVVQGIDALLLYRLARRTLRADQGPAVPAFLTLAGCMGSVFLSEFGNTMGDNVTAALVLAALLAALGRRDAQVVPSSPPIAATSLADAARPSKRGELVAGLCVGIATGLKLTNAPYAIALLAVVGRRHGSRSSASSPRRHIGRYLVGCLVGFLLTYGYWAVVLWRQFGNPFFPQFNRLFGGALAASTIVADDKWAPDGWFEAVLFPYVFSLFPMRIHEVPLVDPLWPAAYTLLVGWLFVRLRGVARAGDERPTHGTVDREAMNRVMAFVVVGYLSWMLVFSIGRYLMAIELLLPLVVWTLLQRLFHRLPHRRSLQALARRAGIVTIAAAALSSVVVDFKTWGNADFATPPFRVDVPVIDDPARSTVLVATAPVAWMLPRFPRELAFVGLNVRFPESAGYRARVARIVAERPGPVYAILPADRDLTLGPDARLNRTLARFGIGRDDLACRFVAAIFRHRPGNDVVVDDGAVHDGCRFRRDVERMPTFDRDATTIARALGTYGFAIDVDRCTLHDASIGAKTYRYRFCPVIRPPTPD